MRVVLLPQVAGNKGDRAVLHFMLEGLIENGVDEIIVSTNDPSRWDDYRVFEGHTIKFVPFAWMTYGEATAHVPFRSIRYYCLRALSKLKARFYRTIGYSVLRSAVVNGAYRRLATGLCYLCNPVLWKAINEADAVITTGGHRLTTLLQPDVVGSQTYGMASVVLASRPLYLWSQTIGGFTFKREINRRLIGAIINHSERVYVRDSESVKHVHQFLEDKGKLRMTCDSVFGLKGAAEGQACIPPSSREMTLGISVYTGRSGREVAYDQYVRSLAALVKRSTADGLRIKFFPMHLDDRYEKKHFLDIISESGCATACEIVESGLSTVEHLRELAKCRMFVGHKTHSIIFALSTATPLIAIAYHFKSLDFMHQYDLAEYGLPESETTPERLIGLYEALKRNLDCVHRKQRRVSEENNNRVRRDFRELIEAITSQPA